MNFIYKKWLPSAINGLFLFFISITLIGAFRSDNLKISTLTNHFFLILLIAILAIVVLLFSKHAKKWIDKYLFGVKKIFVENIGLITGIYFIFGFCLQVFILTNISAPIGWDVSAIFNGVSASPENKEVISNYLSINPNNSFFFFLMYGISKVMNLFNHTWGSSWFVWQLWNIIFMDIGFFILFKAAKHLFNKKVAYLTFYLASFSLMFSPWILVPYTDVIMIPVISAVLLLYAKQIEIKNSGVWNLIFIGILLGICYLLKPSSIVFLIAWTIIMGIKLLTTGKLYKKNVLSFFVAMFFFIITVGCFSIFQKQQTIVNYDAEMQKPWTHFVMMGLTGSGGYSEKDTRKVNSLPTLEKKKKYTTETIKKRLEDYGMVGYTKFLLVKHFNNTDRGDFGWGRDGTPQNPTKPSKSEFQTKLRDTYYQQGKRTNNLRFVMQILWIVVLLGMLLSFFVKDIQGGTLLIIKLTIIGALLYLLLFEGGRSRYLIQYLPFFYLLSANGLARINDIVSINGIKKSFTSTDYRGSLPIRTDEL